MAAGSSASRSAGVLEVGGRLQRSRQWRRQFQRYPLATAEIGYRRPDQRLGRAGEITPVDEEDDTDLEVDVATITIADPDGPGSRPPVSSMCRLAPTRPTRSGPPDAGDWGETNRHRRRHRNPAARQSVCVQWRPCNDAATTVIDVPLVRSPASATKARTMGSR